MAKTRSRRTRSRKSRGRRGTRRSSKRTSYRRSTRKGMRSARRQQKRWGLRMSTKGFRKAKRRGKTRARKSTFFKLRRKARNPQMERRLKDGTVIQLHEEGGGMSRLMVHHPDGRMDDSRLTDAKALSRFKQFKSGKRYKHRAERSEWAMVAADNPRRRGRGRKTRRNCGMGRRNPAQFPAPFASALNPKVRRGEARAMGRVLRRHGYKRCRV